MDATTASSTRAGPDHAAEGDKKVAAKKVPLLGMFRYADRLDVLLMVVGTVGAVANGVSEPLVTLLFGNVINSFGESTAESILRSVSKVVLDFVYLGIGSAVVSFLQVSCWTMAGQRQSARIRSLYLNAVLRQDIAFFDTELTTGQAVSRMSSDTLLVQDALGEKVSHIKEHNIPSHLNPGACELRRVYPRGRSAAAPPPSAELASHLLHFVWFGPAGLHAHSITKH